MTAGQIQDVVARTMNILERDYGADDLLDMGMPTVKEIAATIAKAYAPILEDAVRLEP